MPFSKYNKIILFSLIIVWLFLLMPVAALEAQTGMDKALGGLNSTADEGGVRTAQTNLPTIIGRAVGAILAMVGAIFFILILYAGFSWMTAMGKEERINEAKEMIFAAVIGLIIILAAYAITNLIPMIFRDI